MATLTPEETQEFARRRLGLNSDSDFQRSRLQQDRTLNTSLLNDASVRGQRDVGDQMASQGLFASGIRVNEQGQVVRQTNEALADLGLQTSRGLEDIERRRSTGLGDINFAESEAMANAGRREAERQQHEAQLAAIAAAQQVRPVPPPPPVIMAPAPPPVDPFMQAVIAKLMSGGNPNPNPGVIRRGGVGQRGSF